jgi:hypothetical protein
MRAIIDLRHLSLLWLGWTAELLTHGKPICT